MPPKERSAYRVPIALESARRAKLPKLGTRSQHKSRYNASIPNRGRDRRQWDFAQ